MERFSAAREHAIWFRGGVWEQRWIIPKEEFGDEPLPGLEDYDFLSHFGNVMFLPKAGSYFEEYDPINEEPDLFIHFAKLGEFIYEHFEGYWLTYGLTGHFIQFKERPYYLEQLATPFLERFGHLTIPVGHVLGEAPGTNMRGPLTGDINLVKDFAFTGEKFYDATAFNMFEQSQYVNLAVQYIRFMANDDDMNNLRKLVDSRLARLERPGQNEPIKVEMDRGFPRVIGVKTQFEVAREVERLYGVGSQSDPTIAMAESIIAAQVNSHGGLEGGDVSLELVHTPHAGSSQDWQFVLRYETLLNVIWYQVAKALIEGSAFRTCQNERCQRPSRLFRPARPDQNYCGKNCRDAQGARKYRSRKSQSATSKNLKDILP